VSGSAPNVVNGSFELDTNTTIQPTGWLFTPGTGGSGQVTTGQYNDGSQSYLAVQGSTAGNTAGILGGPYNQSTLSQQYYVISPSKNYTIQFMIMCNRVDISNQMFVSYYTNTQSFITSISVYNVGSGGAPTSWEALSYVITPPSNAYYMTISFNLGYNNASPPGATGNIWIDGVSLSEYNPCQTGLAYTSGTNTFTVPSGIYTLKVTCVAVVNPTTGKTLPGSSIGYMAVIPGDLITVNLAIQLISAVNYAVFAYNTRTFKIISALSGNITFGSSSPTGGFLNMPTALLNVNSNVVILEY